jgi:sugar O-acyltransferase (sialic acid O-acetyltransferase NeuD family)
VTIHCLILGAGGHARVLIDALRRQAPLVGYALLDADPKLWTTLIMDVPIIGGDEYLTRLDAEYFIVGVGSTGSTAIRRRLFEQAIAAGLRPQSVIHDRALIAEGAMIGPGAQILAGAIVNTGAELGRNVLVNTGAIVEHDCRIEDHAHVATGARLAGGVQVGLGAHIGIGAVVRQNQIIGSGAIVGAGAVVVDDVAPHTTVAGVPARLL